MLVAARVLVYLKETKLSTTGLKTFSPRLLFSLSFLFFVVLFCLTFSSILGMFQVVKNQDE